MKPHEPGASGLSKTLDKFEHNSATLTGEHRKAALKTRPGGTR